MGGKRTGPGEVHVVPQVLERRGRCRSRLGRGIAVHRRPARPVVAVGARVVVRYVEVFVVQPGVDESGPLHHHHVAVGPGVVVQVEVVAVQSHRGEEVLGVDLLADGERDGSSVVREPVVGAPDDGVLRVGGRLQFHQQGVAVVQAVVRAEVPQLREAGAGDRYHLTGGGLLGDQRVAGQRLAEELPAVQPDVLAPVAGEGKRTGGGERFLARDLLPLVARLPGERVVDGHRAELRAVELHLVAFGGGQGVAEDARVRDGARAVRLVPRAEPGRVRSGDIVDVEAVQVEPASLVLLEEIRVVLQPVLVGVLAAAVRYRLPGRHAGHRRAAVRPARLVVMVVEAFRGRRGGGPGRGAAGFRQLEKQVQLLDCQRGAAGPGGPGTAGELVDNPCHLEAVALGRIMRKRNHAGIPVDAGGCRWEWGGFGRGTGIWPGFAPERRSLSGSMPIKWNRYYWPSHPIPTGIHLAPSFFGKTTLPHPGT